MKRAGRPVVAARGHRGGFVLDSHALLAYFEGEPSGEVVRALIQDAEHRRARLYLSLINWGELFYIVRREKGELACTGSHRPDRHPTD